MLISAALSLASLGAKAISGIKNSIAMGKEKKSLEGQRNSLDDWYNAESNQDYLNTEQSQSVLAKLRESLKRNNAINANTSEVMGGTVESDIANKEISNQAVSDTMVGLGGQATAYKNDIRKDYQGQKTAIDGKISAINVGQAQSAANAGSNAMGALGSVISANKMDAFGGQKVGGIFKDLFKKPEATKQFSLTAPKAAPIVWPK
jgi:hypothetical protein